MDCRNFSNDLAISPVRVEIQPHRASPVSPCDACLPRGGLRLRRLGEETDGENDDESGPAGHRGHYRGDLSYRRESTRGLQKDCFASDEMGKTDRSNKLQSRAEVS